MSKISQNHQTAKSPVRRTNSTSVVDTIRQLPPKSFILVNPNFSFSPVQNSRVNAKIPRSLVSNYVAANFNFIYKNASQIDKSKISELNDIIFSHTFFSNTAPLYDLLFCAIAHQSDEYVCPICLFKPTAPRMTRCGHIFCADCLYLLFAKTEKHLCPVCYEPILKNELLRVKLILHPPIMTKCKFKKVVKFSKLNVCRTFSKKEEGNSNQPSSSINLNSTPNLNPKSQQSFQCMRTQSENRTPSNQTHSNQMPIIESFRRLPKASDPDSLFTRFSLSDDDFVSEILGEEIFYIDQQIKEVAEINDLEKINALKTIRTSLVTEEQPEDNTEFQLIPEDSTFSDELITFYQIEDGRLIFLDDLNMKMIHDNYGENSVDDWPDTVEGDIICRSNFVIEQTYSNQQSHQKFEENFSSENQEFINKLQLQLHLSHLHPGAEVSSVLIDLSNSLKPYIVEKYRKRVQIRRKAEQMKSREGNKNKKRGNNQHVITKADYQTFVSHNEPENIHLTNDDFPSLQPTGSSPPVFKHLPPPAKPKEDFPSLDDGNSAPKSVGVKKQWGGFPPPSSQNQNEKNVYKEEYPAFEATKPVARKKKKTAPAWGNLKI